VGTAWSHKWTQRPEEISVWFLRRYWASSTATCACKLHASSVNPLSIVLYDFFILCRDGKLYGIILSLSFKWISCNYTSKSSGNRPARCRCEWTQCYRSTLAPSGSQCMSQNAISHDVRGIGQVLLDPRPELGQHQKLISSSLAHAY